MDHENKEVRDAWQRARAEMDALQTCMNWTVGAALLVVLVLLVMGVI
jgi:hypothetical protein